MVAELLELLSALADARAEYLIVGGHAVAVYVEERETDGLDLYVRASHDNARLVHRALAAFGVPTHEVSIGDLSHPGPAIRLPVPGRRIEIFTAIDGLSFEEAYASRTELELAGVLTPVIGRKLLLHALRTAGRPEDLLDAERLEQAMKAPRGGPAKGPPGRR